VGRKKDMIITGGLNVYPAEVEARLLEHPAVAQACVVGVPDRDWGERVVAAIVLRDGQEAPQDADALTQELREFVRSEKGSVQTPKDLKCVTAIPVTKIGKPDKNAMRDTMVELLG
jgi:fatty-acyl-CoA synthase